MYADLQFPRSSNFGSMKRRGEAEVNIVIVIVNSIIIFIMLQALPPSHPPSHYARIQFSPSRSEKADLWQIIQNNRKESKRMSKELQRKPNATQRRGRREGRKEEQQWENQPLKKNFKRIQKNCKRIGQEANRRRRWRIMSEKADLWQRGNFGRMWIWNVRQILLLQNITQWQLICWGGVHKYVSKYSQRKYIYRKWSKGVW